MNDATRGTLNEAAFAAMKDGVRIVNLARGELVDDPCPEGRPGQRQVRRLRHRLPQQ